eukprot:664327_1
MFGPLLHSSDNTNSSLPILARTQPSKRIAAHQYLTARHMGVVAKDISCICDDYCDASDNYGNYLLISLTWTLTWTCALILPIHIANTIRSIPDVSPIDWAIRAYNRGINRPEIALLDDVKQAVRPPPAMYASHQFNHNTALHFILLLSLLILSFISLHKWPQSNAPSIVTTRLDQITSPLGRAIRVRKIRSDVQRFYVSNKLHFYKH